MGLLSRFASLDDFKAADASLQQQVLGALEMPDFLQSRPYSELNGYCGSCKCLGHNNELQEYSYWSRFIIKQTGRTLRAKPSFVRHDASISPKVGEAVIGGVVPLHDHRSAKYGWEWYEMMLAMRWKQDLGTTIICFDVPAHVQHAIGSRLRQLTVEKRLLLRQDPFGVLTVILQQMLAAYDRSVWAIRDHVCDRENERLKTPDYALLYEISRHAIHVSESLEVAARSCKALLKQSEDFYGLVGERAKEGRITTFDELQLVIQVVENLMSRSEANRARIQNEINLVSATWSAQRDLDVVERCSGSNLRATKAFHLVAQRDSQTQLRMAVNMQNETIVMRNLSLVAVAFLPATFICGIFGTAFFGTDPNGGFFVSGKFWIFWATVIPISFTTIVIWWWYSKEQGHDVQK